MAGSRAASIRIASRLEREAARPRFAYEIPFGGGPRGYIGNQFAMVEAQLIVAAIAQRYRIEVVPGQQIRAEALITLRPSPAVRARLTKRTSPAPVAAA